MKNVSNCFMFKKTLLCSLIFVSMYPAYAGVVRSDVDYQQFRDFAENKGKFQVGATNIEIKDKDGNTIETMFENGMAMPDWSAVFTGSLHQNDSQGGSKGAATLIHPQYIVGVAHYVDYGDVQFGTIDNKNPDNEKFNYKTVKYHNFSKKDKTHDDEIIDYHHPRLHKLVTEIVPIDTVKDQKTILTQEDLLKFKERYPLLLRIGAGNQKIQDINSDFDNLWEAYFGNSNNELFPKLPNSNYLTGGLPLPPVISYRDGKYIGFLDTVGKLTDKDISKMTVIGLHGDSGSPIYAYDNFDKKWKFIGAYAYTYAGFYHENYRKLNYAWALNKHDFNEKKRNEDIAGGIFESNKILNWKPDGNNGKSIIESDVGELLSVDLYNPNLADKESDVETIDTFEVQPVLSREHHGKTFIIHGENNILNLTDTINQGAGAIYFNGNTTVKSDDKGITWLGSGVSVAKDKTVNWAIKNPKGDRLSKVGEGTLIVDGIGDNEGDISVGDGLVILNQKDGMAFNRVGIVSGRPTVKLENEKQVNPNNIYFGYRGGRLDVNGNDLNFDYIQNIDDGAVIVNNNKEKASTITLSYDTSDKYKSSFNGSFGENNENYHNGKLNIVYKPKINSNVAPLLLSGGLNMNGDLSIKSGSLLLSGRPTTHAYDHINMSEAFKDNDWVNRSFKVNNLIVENDGIFSIGRNVDNFVGNITLKNSSIGNIGFVNDKTNVCVRSDYYGYTNCSIQAYDESILDTIPTTQAIGDVFLHEDSKLNLGKVNLLGRLESDKNTNLILSKDAKWKMTNNSTLGSLSMTDGSEITLNKNFTSGSGGNFNILTIKGDLVGKGKFNYLTDLSKMSGDKVEVDGDVSGEFLLNVKDQGVEPKKTKEHLILFSTSGAVSQAPILANDGRVVDLGAYRYALKSDDNKIYYLWSEGLEYDIDKQAEEDAKRKAEEDAKRKAEEDAKRKAEEDAKKQGQFISKYSNVAISAQDAQLKMVANITALNGRLSDVDPKYTGVWLHTHSGRYDHQSRYHRPYNDKQDLLQFGIDGELYVGKDELIVGASFSSAKGSQDFSEGVGKSHLMMGHLYGKWLFGQNAFLGVDTGYGKVRQDIELGEKARYTQKFANIGIMAGKAWQFGHISAKPSIVVRHYRAFDGQSYGLEGANIELPNLVAMAYQPSLRLGYERDLSTGLKINPYVSISYNKWQSNASLKVNGYNFSIPFDDTWQYGLGLETQKGKFSGRLHVVYDKDQNNGDGYSAGLNVGYRW